MNFFILSLPLARTANQWRAQRGTCTDILINVRLRFQVDSGPTESVVRLACPLPHFPASGRTRNFAARTPCRAFRRRGGGIVVSIGGLVFFLIRSIFFVIGTIFSMISRSALRYGQAQLISLATAHSLVEFAFVLKAVPPFTPHTAWL